MKNKIMNILLVFLLSFSLCFVIINIANSFVVYAEEAPVIGEAAEITEKSNMDNWFLQNYDWIIAIAGAALSAFCTVIAFIKKMKKTNNDLTVAITKFTKEKEYINSISNKIDDIANEYKDIKKENKKLKTDISEIKEMLKLMAVKSPELVSSGAAEKVINIGEENGKEN